jgi:prepilin peptidase CpaA
MLMGVCAIAEDLARRRVSNCLVLAGLVCGLALHAAAGGWHGLGIAAAGAVLGFAVLLPFHLLGAMGGGDVKLMAAFGALLGPAGILLAAVLAAILGGVWAAASSLRKPGRAAIPFAPAIVLGAWASWFGGGA